MSIYAGIFLAQYRKKERGTIVRFESLINCRSGGFGVIVRLKDGKEANATVSGCTVCMDNLGEGSTVNLLNLGGEYVITQSPLDSLRKLKSKKKSKKKCNSDSINSDEVKRTV